MVNPSPAKLGWSACLGVVAFLSGCSCEHVTKSEDRSPSGERIATVTQIHCGPPGDDGTQLNLRAANTSFSGRRGVVVALEGRQVITVHWESDTQLTVFLPASALPKDFVEPKIPTQNTDVEGVHIEYRYL